MGNITNLVPDIFARVCVLVVFAYAAGRIPPFRRVLREPLSTEDWIFRVVYFASLAVIEATITPRYSAEYLAPLAAVTGAGLLAGPATGMITGVVGLAATPIWDGGWIVGVAMVVIGGVVGLVGRWKPALADNAVAGMFTGAAAELTWAGFTAGRHALAGLSIGPPVLTEVVVLMSAFQVGVFVAMVSDIRAGQQRVDREAMLRALRMARTSLGQGRSAGVDEDAAANIVALIRSVTGIPGVEVAAGLESLARTKHSDHPRREQMCSALMYSGVTVGELRLWDPEKGKVNPQVAQLAIELAQFMVEYHLRLRELQEQTEAVSRTELKALQAQVHPHFLFNALNTLAALCQLDAKQANRLTVRLGEFLRSSLQATAQNLVPFDRELSVVRAYLEIERARFQEGLMVIERIEEDVGDVFVPPFALQTLVENAVVHGIANKVTPGHLTLSARMRGDRLVCMVIDDGELPEIAAPENRRAGPHGLEILRARLKNIYGDGAGVRLRKRSGDGMIALLWLATGRLSS